MTLNAELGPNGWEVDPIVDKSKLSAAQQENQNIKNVAGADISGGIYDAAGNLANQALKPSSMTLLDFQFSDSPTGWSTGSNHTVAYDATLRGLSIKGSGVAGTNISTTKALPNPIPASMVNQVAVKIKTKTPGLRAEMYIRFGNASNVFSSIGAHSLLSVSDAADDGWQWWTFDVSEDAAFSTLGTLTQLRFQTNTQNASSVYLNNLVIQKVVINPDVVSPIVFTFDDGWDTAYTRSYPMLSEAGFKGTVFWPSEGGNVGADRRIDVNELTALKLAGWDVSLDGTYNDDPPMTSYASPDAAVQAFLRCQQSAFSSGLMSEDFNYLCYPNGAAWVSASPVLIPAATSNGTTTVSLGSAATVVNGSAYYAANAPEGTTVVTGGVGVTSITVSQNIPAGTIAAAAVDISSAFNRNAITDRLAAVGVKGARLTSNGDNSIIEGLTNPLKIYAMGITNKSTTTILAELDLAIKRKRPVVYYFHEQVADPQGWTVSTANPSINIYDSSMQAIIDAAAGYVANGQAEGFTFKQMVNKYTNMR